MTFFHHIKQLLFMVMFFLSLWQKTVLHGSAASYLFSSCPFIHDDPLGQSFTQILGSIENLIKDKHATSERCKAPLMQVTKNYQNINGMLNFNQNPILQYQVTGQVLSAQIKQLELDLLNTPTTSPMYNTLMTSLMSLKSQMSSNQVQSLYNQGLFQQNRANFALGQNFQSMQNIIQTLSSMDAECIDVIGGWQHILPPLLSSMAQLSVLGGMQYGLAAGMALQTVASLMILLKDVKAKRALKHLIRHRNEKILACTYYAVQSTSCEYQRASRLVHKIDTIELGQFAHQDIYLEFFKLRNYASELADMFTKIEQMNLPPSTDISLLNRYSKIKQLSPTTILKQNRLGIPPSNEDDQSDEAEKKRLEWVLRAKDFGIPVTEIFSPGVPTKTLAQQVKDILVFIDQTKKEEMLLEKIFSTRRSFLELKRDLDLRTGLPNLLKNYLDFFQKSLEQGFLHEEKKSILVPIQRLFSAILDLCSLSMGDNYDEYVEKVNEKGSLILVLARESSTNPLAYNPPGEILSQIFQIIETGFYEKNQEEYTEFKKNASILATLRQTYPFFAGSSQAFRMEDAELAFRTLERSYHKEFFSMMKTAFNQTSYIYPELQGTTGAHMCALFNHAFLQGIRFQSRRVNRIKKYCQAHYESLPLLPNMEPKEIPIVWDDPCFYTSYQRFFQAQKALHQIMIERHLPQEPL